MGIIWNAWPRLSIDQTLDLTPPNLATSALYYTAAAHATSTTTLNFVYFDLKHTKFEEQGNQNGVLTS